MWGETDKSVSIEWNNIHWLKYVFWHARDIILIIDSTGKICEANGAAEKAYGYSSRELLGLTIYDLQENVVPRRVSDFIGQNNTLGTLFETLHCRKDGSVFPVEITMTGFEFKGSRLLMSTIRDITQKKYLQKDVNLSHYYDTLTELPNRVYFEQILAKQSVNQASAVLVCDINGLGAINHKTGFTAGDLLLVQVANILLRSIAGLDAKLARIGSSEFAVLLRNVSLAAAENLLAKIKKRVTGFNDQSKFQLSLAFGMAFSAEGIGNANSLFLKAESRMNLDKLYCRYSRSNSLVKTLNQVAKERDGITRWQAERLTILALKFAKRLKWPQYKRVELQLLAQFHDIGEVGIADFILLKPAELTGAERKTMQKHCEIGYRIARSSPELAPIADLILKHHERWDGTGYPLKLQGEAIPVECRVIALIDAYHAMTRDRPYCRAISKAAALAEIERCKGSQFDPWLAEEFIGFMEAERMKQAGCGL